MGVTDDVTRYVENLPSWGKAVLAGGVSLAIYVQYKWLTGRERKSPLKEDWKDAENIPGNRVIRRSSLQINSQMLQLNDPNMFSPYRAGHCGLAFAKCVVYLYQFPRTKAIPSISPYCLKVETWLRMAEINYEIVPCSLSTRSREGSLPFVEHNGKEYPDSSFIIRDLSIVLDKKHMEDHLSEEQRAVSRAFEKMAELSLVQSHYIFMIENVDKLLELLPPHLFGGIFYPLIIMLMKRGFANSKRTAMAISGIGKHSREETIGIGLEDLRAISKYLGSKHYFTGFKPTRVDAALFGVLAQIAFAPYDNDHLNLMRNECSNLLEYVERVKHRYWPDWGEATTLFITDSNWKRRPKKDSPRLNGSLSPASFS